MRTPTSLRLHEHQRINAVIAAARAFSSPLPPPHVLVRLLRLRLGMTQAQLAKRAGLGQSQLAKIETGKGDPRLSTLRRLLNGLYCDLVVAAAPRQDLEDLVRERVRATARRRVARVSGTMSLERQDLEPAVQEELVRREESDLLRKRSPEIWEEL